MELCCQSWEQKSKFHLRMSIPEIEEGLSTTRGEMHCVHPWWQKGKKNQKKKSSNPRFPVVQKAWESPDFLLPFGLKCGGLEVKSRQKPPCHSRGIVRGKFCQPGQGGNVSRVRKSTRGRSLEGQEVFMGGRTKVGRKWIHSQGRGAALFP